MPRHTFRFVRRGLSRILFASLPLALGCADLGFKVEGQCGNEVIEPSNGEDCDCGPAPNDAGPTCEFKSDLAEGKTFACNYAQSGQERPCRLSCTRDAECLPGSGCGNDGICRKPVPGAFELLGGGVQADTDRLFAADLDGDGRDDVLAAGSTGISALYYERSGGLGSVTNIRTDGRLPGIGRLTKDARSEDPAIRDPSADLVLGVGIGLSVFHGQPGRSFAPRAYGTIPALAFAAGLGLPGEKLDASHIVAHHFVGIDYFLSTAADAYLLFGGFNAGTPQAQGGLLRLLLGDDPGLEPKMTTAVLALGVNSHPEGLSGPTPAADLDGDGRPEIALAFRLRDAVDIYAPFLLPTTIPPPLSIALRQDGVAKARVAGPAFFHDMDGNGRLDVVVGTTCPVAGNPTPAELGKFTCFEIEVAYNTPSGFSSTNDPNNIDNRASSFAEVLPTYAKGQDQVNAPAAYLPRVLADLNEDGRVDMVNDYGVFLKIDANDSTLGIPYHIAIGTGQDARAAVVVGDFNIDEHQDILLAGQSTSEITFLAGSGNGLFAISQIPTLGPVRQFTLGDFDGDGLRDLAFVEEPPISSTSDMPALAVSFGRPYAPPASPLRMARVKEVVDLARIGFSAFGRDSIDDLGLTFTDTDGEKSLSFIVGTDTRLLQPPYVLTTESDPGKDQSPVFGLPIRFFVGHFDVDPLSDVAAISPWSGATPTPTEGTDLWLLPNKGDAYFDTSAAKPYLLADIRVDGDKSRFLDGVVVDLNENTADKDDPGADGIDELVLTGSTTKNESNLLILRPESGTFKETSASGVVERYRERLRAADFDADGRKDILAVEYTPIPGKNGNVRRGATRLVIYWNDGQGGLCFGTGEGCAPTIFEAVDLDFIEADALDFDEDAQKEIVLATSSGVFVLDLGGPNHREFVTEPALLPLPAQSFSTLRVCDVSGDGVDDIAIASEGNVYVYEGKPALR